VTSNAVVGSGGLSARPRGLRLASALERVSQHAPRYGLVLVLLWIGGMKFTRVEAEAIEGLVAHSPFLGWMYGVLSVQATSALIGSAELVIAGLIAARPLSATLAMAGSALAAGMFLTTLSFLWSTPGVFEASLGGFPALSVLPGQFLLKDVVLLAVALWSFVEARKARTSRPI
jgi:uncharacterized membrane protein YkgB